LTRANSPHFVITQEQVLVAPTFSHAGDPGSKFDGRAPQHAMMTSLRDTATWPGRLVPGHRYPKVRDGRLAVHADGSYAGNWLSATRRWNCVIERHSRIKAVMRGLLWTTVRRPGIVNISGVCLAARSPRLLLQYNIWRIVAIIAPLTFTRRNCYKSQLSSDNKIQLRITVAWAPGCNSSLGSQP